MPKTNSHNPNYPQRKYHPHPAHRRIVMEIVKEHDERLSELAKCKRRIEEIYTDVKSPRLDGMPQSKKPFVDVIGERVDKVSQLQKYIDRNQEMVDAVEDSLWLIGRGRKITKAMVEEYGSKAKVLFWARKSIELSIKNGEAGCDYGRWPWNESYWKHERRDFVDRIAAQLCFGKAPSEPL